MEKQCVDYFNKWQVMAKGKSADAMSMLAELYYQGHGTKKSLEKSIQYFRKASIYQSAYAQYRVGIFYLMEEDFIDTDKGIKYLRKAAKNGNVESAFLLGAIFGTGELGIKDVGESDKWLVKALEDKHLLAQKYAAYLYKTGQVDKEHYIKVNKVISKLSVQTIKDEEFTERLSKPSTEIQWLNLPNSTANRMKNDSLENVFNYTSFDIKKVIAEDDIVIESSKIKCGKIFTCYQVNKNNFRDSATSPFTAL
ncbi:tetratricopeptide repeat protein [Colwellia sp. Bg11-28]|uniref:tetratricopeptide repeat protein n=1 Tax=Colwellia sp. Bg11-28 TaxID=2058305 RepID=UPI000C323C48|nr:tetratricopeptide repeat protein [Colwellia sp. Bg11-28]PKH89110.1 hypothetical protein CXF79_02375 [Colwellia sp. Bg11-28]